MYPASGTSRASAPIIGFNTGQQLMREADQIRADIVQLACTENRFPQATRFETYSLSADEVKRVKLRMPDDLIRVATWIAERQFPYVKGHALMRAAAGNLRKATSENSSLELAMVIACARVMRGTSCPAAAQEHGIPATRVVSDTWHSLHSPREELEWAVCHEQSVARWRVSQGEPCDMVAYNYSLHHKKVRSALERFAISCHGPAMAQRGKSPDEIVASLGVYTDEGKRIVEEMVSNNRLQRTKSTQTDFATPNFQ
ncbi:hypothetical protein [Burkholderia latens]|uniref:hypothetical protein n=1 Tax=Burkholderia latens TaxID=488446 RepID=UPI00158A62BB|nr:hypothetical protein [Burkholderia latens]